MVISSCGYSGTGSSAIIHLLSEYSNCYRCNEGNYEHNLLYMPDGIFDLEDRLVYNNSIHMFDGAIHRFRSAMLRLNDNDFLWFGGYKKRYGSQFMKIVDEFIEHLTQFTIPGYWDDDIINKINIGKVFQDSARNILHKKIRGDFGHDNIHLGDELIRFSFLSREEYCNIAKEFICNYFKMVSGAAGGKIALYDQLFLPQNLYRLKNYFGQEELKVIISERDPRDMFVLSKYVWPKILNSPYTYPTNPEEFCRYYKLVRNTERNFDTSMVLRIYFEDLVYKYEETVSLIENFLGTEIGKHSSKYSVFKPEVSIKNTQNFRIDESWKAEIDLICDRLSGYLYNFPCEFKPSLDEASDP